MIPIGEEVATYIDFDQFVREKSAYTCGFAAVMLNRYATERGKPYGATIATLQAMQALWYSRFDGQDVPANHDGMTLQQLYNLIVDVGNHYQNLYPDGGIPADKLKSEFSYWVGNGYPVISGVAESSVHDVGLGKGPYSWDTTGLSHIITVTGVTKSGNVLVRDTANVGRPGPREYDLARLTIYEATVIVPGSPIWLKRPYDAWNVEEKPTQHIPAPILPAPPTKMSNAEIITALEQMVAEAQKIIAGLK